MKNMIKSALRRYLWQRGYQIGKCPTTEFRQLPLFDVLVTGLMAQRGAELRFVQVGANDGVYGDSISRYALRYPWRGLLVEPQPDVYARLRQNYAKAPGQMLFENVAVGAAGRADLVLYRAKATAETDGTYPSSVVSFDRAAVAQQLNLSVDALEEIKVPCVPLDSILSKHRWTDVDVLLIDTEGLDLEVLRSLTLAQTSPTIVQFEHGHLSPQQIDKAVQYLSVHGYQVNFGGHYTDTLAVHPRFWAADF